MDLGSFAKQKKYISINLQDTVGYLNATKPLHSMTDVLELYGITDFFLRPNKQDFVHTVCNPHSIDARGGENQDNPDIIVISENCTSTDALKLIIRPYTRITNHARSSQFNYLVPHENKGENTVDLQPDGSTHRFFFDYAIHDISSIKKIDNTLHFAFKNEFKLRITQYGKNIICQFNDYMQIKVEKDEIYALQSTHRTIDYIIEYYPKVANQLNLFMIVRSLATNDSITIGHSKHEILSNDPDRRSHLIGNGGENVFVISSGLEVLDKNKSPIIPEVVLYDVDPENLIDTLDLRQIRNQLEKDLGLKVQLKTRMQAQDILIELFSPTDVAKKLVTVRLKNALNTNWHNRLHIILNHVPIEFFSAIDLKQAPLNFGPDKEIIIISPEDVEENTKLVISKKSGNYRFSRVSNNLLISNAFASNLTAIERYTLSLQKFYQTPKLETLSIQFLDKEIVLKNEMAKIEYAPDFAVEYEQYRRTTYDGFFNRNVGQENVRSARHVQANVIVERGADTGIWEMMSPHVLPVIAAAGMLLGAGVGLRYQLRNRLRAAAMPLAQAAVVSPLLSVTVEAKSKNQEVPLANMTALVKKGDLLMGGCTFGARNGEVYVPHGFTCRENNQEMIFFLKDPEVKLEKPDKYLKESCRPVEFNGRPSMYCEGKEKSNIVYTPNIAPSLCERIFGQASDQILLGQVVFHLGKRFYNWLRKSPSEKTMGALPLVVAITSEQKTRWIELLIDIETRVTHLDNTGKIEDNLRWVRPILEDRKEEYKSLSQKSQASLEEVTILTENLQALQAELEVMIEPVSTTNSDDKKSAVRKEKEEISNDLNPWGINTALLSNSANQKIEFKPGIRQGFFKEILQPTATFLPVHATNSTMSFTGKQGVA